MVLFFGVGSLTAVITTNLMADIPPDGCGTAGNCYYIPAGCGPGVGCKSYFCSSPGCPESNNSPGDVCYKCVE